MAIANYNWKTKKDGELFEIAKGTLTEEAKAWFYFMNSSLLPSKHVSTLLLYVILRNYKFDVGNIIQQSLLEEDTLKLLIHPTLITQLCRDAGVMIAEDEEKCPSLVPISFPIKKRQGASTSAPENSAGPSGDT